SCRQLGLPLASLRAASSATQDATQRVKKKRKKSSSSVKWIACSSTTEVTRAIEKYVQQGDVVGELGSQLRESSISLCENIGPTGKAVLVDIERKFPNEKKGEKRTSAMRREGDENEFYTDRAIFLETKGFEFWRDALFFRENPKPQYNALVVDVSTVAGNDLDLTCISLVKEFIALNQGSGESNNHCRAVIVKSGSLHNLARRLYHAQRIISGAQSLDERSTGGHSSIVGAVGVKQYRDTIPFLVRKGDVCIEVGCHMGTSTTLIDEAAQGNQQSDGAPGGCLGVDVGPHIIKSARVKYPHLKFEVGDGFKTGELARMKDKHFTCCTGEHATYDVVFVDIGGLSGSEGLLEAISLLASISNSLEPRCIVIKSLCIRRLASCLVPFSEIWRKESLSK
ncbi:hypothetical protein ACHAXR_010708, partial [Thalassiosira sp. AJA248-18]